MYTYLEQTEENALDDEALIGLDHDRQNYNDSPKETAQARKDDISAGTV